MLPSLSKCPAHGLATGPLIAGDQFLEPESFLPRLEKSAAAAAKAAQEYANDFFLKKVAFAMDDGTDSGLFKDILRREVTGMLAAHDAPPNVNTPAEKRKVFYATYTPLGQTTSVVVMLNLVRLPSLLMRLEASEDQVANMLAAMEAVWPVTSHEFTSARGGELALAFLWETMEDYDAHAQAVYLAADKLGDAVVVGSDNIGMRLTTSVFAVHTPPPWTGLAAWSGPVQQAEATLVPPKFVADAAERASVTSDRTLPEAFAARPDALQLFLNSFDPPVGNGLFGVAGAKDPLKDALVCELMLNLAPSVKNAILALPMGERHPTALQEVCRVATIDEVREQVAHEVRALRARLAESPAAN
jgi:hypothetical protein